MGVGNAAFIFIIGPHILLYRVCIVPILLPPCECGVCPVLPPFHSLPPRALVIHLSLYCLHKCILQLPCCFPYLLWQVLFCQYCCSPTCLVLCIMSLPVFITKIVQEHPLWSIQLGSTITLYVHGLQSSYWTTTIDPAERTEGFFKCHCPCYIYFDGPPRPHILHHHYLYL